MLLGPVIQADVGSVLFPPDPDFVEAELGKPRSGRGDDSVEGDAGIYFDVLGHSMALRRRCEFYLVRILGCGPREIYFIERGARQLFLDMSDDVG